MATSLFQALGNLGSDYGTAAESVRQDKLKAAYLARQLQNQDAEMQIRRGTLQNAIDRLNFEKQKEKDELAQKGWDKALNFRGVGNKRYQFNLTTKEMRDYELPAGATEPGSTEGKVQDVEGALHRPLTDDEKGIIAGTKAKPTSVSPYEVKLDNKRQYVYVPKDPASGLKTVNSGIYGPPPRPNGDVVIPDSPYIKAMADKWNKEGIKPPAKYLPLVEKYMEDRDMKAAVILSPLEKRQVELIKQIEPKISRATQLIETNGLQENNNILYGKYSRLNIEKAWQMYKKGFAPKDPVLAETIKTAAALNVMGAAPWVAIGRGKYMFETISQHLPQPTDTFANLYVKLHFLQQVIDDAKTSFPPNAIGGFSDAEEGGDSAVDAALDRLMKPAPKPK